MSSESLSNSNAAESSWSRLLGLTNSLVVCHLIMIAVQLPLVILNFANLWKSSPHYRFFPFLFAAFAYMVFARWPKSEPSKFVKSNFANLLLAGGIVFSLAATAFVNPSFATVSAILFAGSLLSRTKDGSLDVDSIVKFRTLLPVWFLLLLVVRPPFGLDVDLITGLQRLSARSTSLLLDLVGYDHSMPGTVLVLPGKSYFVEEACSGVQSFFTLLFCSALYCVWTRRGPVHSIFLLAFAIFWAIVMNILRIFVIPIFDLEFGMDLTKGLPHDILGYAVLVFAVLMIASTDRLLSFILAPIPMDEANAVVRWVRSAIQFLTLSKVRSRIRARRLELEETDDQPDANDDDAPSKGFRYVLYSIAGLIVVTSIVQSIDAARMASSDMQVMFGLDKIVDLEEHDVPLTIGTWNRVNYERFDRSAASELGQRSDTWELVGSTLSGHGSLDQPFAGWHDLTVCYTNQGWQLSSDRVVLQESHPDLGDWDYVEVEMKNALGEHGYLLFGFFDLTGNPVAAPDDSSPLGFLFQRIRNRLNYRIRKQLFQADVYQVQVFIQTHRPLTEIERTECKEHFILFRENLRQKFLAANDQAGSS